MEYFICQVNNSNKFHVICSYPCKCMEWTPQVELFYLLKVCQFFWRSCVLAPELLKAPAAMDDATTCGVLDHLGPLITEGGGARWVARPLGFPCSEERKSNVGCSLGPWLQWWERWGALPFDQTPWPKLKELEVDAWLIQALELKGRARWVLDLMQHCHLLVCWSWVTRYFWHLVKLLGVQ